MRRCLVVVAAVVAVTLGVLGCTTASAPAPAPDQSNIQLDATTG